MDDTQDIFSVIDAIYILISMQRLQLISQSMAKNSRQMPLKGKTVVITGASRGIGLAIAIRCAKDGANIAILSKTTIKHPKLPGTIYTAAEQITKAGGRALPIQCDIRFEDQVKRSIQTVVQVFGGIDILINNASAINQTNIIDQTMKQYDLMHDIILRGAFMVTKYCLPHLLRSKTPKILNITFPPGHYSPRQKIKHLAYSLAKNGVTQFTVGLAEEFRQKEVIVSALWSTTMVGTAAVKNVLGGDEVLKKTRKPQMMADAAYIILTKKDISQTGKFYYDEDLLRQNGVQDFSQYNYDFNDNEFKRQTS